MKRPKEFERSPLIKFRDPIPMWARAFRPISYCLIYSLKGPTFKTIVLLALMYQYYYSYNKGKPATTT